MKQINTIFISPMKSQSSSPQETQETNIIAYLNYETFQVGILPVFIPVWF